MIALNIESILASHLRGRSCMVLNSDVRVRHSAITAYLDASGGDIAQSLTSPSVLLG